MRAKIVVADSVTALDARHADTVVISGSHGGSIAARYVLAARARAAVFNDAGIGLDDAGVAGLRLLQAAGMAAAAVSHQSARIGEGADTLACGVVSRVNAIAAACGAAVGMKVAGIVERLRDAPLPANRDASTIAVEGRRVLREASPGAEAIVAVDSIGLVVAADARCVLVIGSHGGLHGGDPRSALGVRAEAAFFHDAGRGKDDAGVARLPVLARRGIAAGSVDYRTARIGDAVSMWERGVLSCVNDVLTARGVRAGMSVSESVASLQSYAADGSSAT